MIDRQHQMAVTLEEVDPTVVFLKREVSAVLGTATATRFEICLSEVLTNIVKHAAPTMPDAEVKMTLKESADTLSVSVFDPPGAAPFDLRDHAPDFDAVDPLAEGGRGLGFIKQCADAVDYGHSDAGNRLVLTFRKGTS